jgi:phenylacetyl-CoA:acceptor oxidoreductase subunit 2
MNFMCGGAGSGLLMAAPVAPRSWYPAIELAGACAISVGLFFVWLEIGRPFRSLNVFIHAKTSWMTRESWASLVGLSASAIAAMLPGVGLVAVAALAGGVFLYCQARILTAAKGIPAWRLPIVSAVILMSGFLEGMALLVLFGTPVVVGLFLCIVVRGVLWRRYRALARRGAVPERAWSILKRYFPVVEVAGTVVPAVLLLLHVALGLPFTAAIGALLAFAGGWLFKFILVTRLGFNQGFAVPKFPQIGGLQPSSSKPGWPSSP